MILQELARFYEIREEVPRLGFRSQKVDFVLTIDLTGNLVKVIPKDQKILAPKIPQGRTNETPPYKKVGFIFEEFRYVLGYSEKINEIVKKLAEKEQKKLDTASNHAESYKLLLEECFSYTNSNEIKSIIIFLEKLKKDQIDNLLLQDIFEFVGKNKKPKISIQIEDSFDEIWNKPELKSWWINKSLNSLEDEDENSEENLTQKKKNSKEEIIYGQCLISGNSNIQLSRLHPSLEKSLVENNNNAGFVSFNKDAFISYKKEKSYNAPCSVEATNAYGNALQYLFDKDNYHRADLEKCAICIWTEEKSEFESIVEESIFPQNKSEKQEEIEEPLSFEEDEEIDLEAENNKKKTQKKQKEKINIASIKGSHGEYAQKGIDPRNRLSPFIKDNDKNKISFYVLGISAPSEARLSVRFWHESNIQKTAKSLKQYFDDLEIIGYQGIKADFHLFRLVRATVRRYVENGRISYAKNKKGQIDVHENIESEFMKAALFGLEFPQTALQSVICRVKSEQGLKIENKRIDNITPERAALLKAYLNRLHRRRSGRNSQLIKSCMDRENLEMTFQNKTAYRLGRLFAVYERIQELYHRKAHPTSKINSTIKDRFYSGALSSPSTVFISLEKLASKHLARFKSSSSEAGLKVWFSQITGEIMGTLQEPQIKGWPSSFSLEEQGLFILGYYQQRQWFFSGDGKEQEKEQDKNTEVEQGEE